MEQACAVKPKMIVAGASAYPRAIDFKKLREIADACGAYLMVDMTHRGPCRRRLPPQSGPVCGRRDHHDAQTLRGPRGHPGREEFAKQIDKAIFPGTRAAADAHHRGKAVCLGEALKPEFKTYAEQTVKNAQRSRRALRTAA